MQNYRNHTNDYSRRGNMNYNRGCSSNRTAAPSPTPYTSYSNASSCYNRDDVLEGMHLAMAYVPWQNWRHIYSVEKAFCRGTIFEELDKPFHGMGGCNQ